MEDIPLFREIQRLLAAGQGPLNLEIARQIAGAIVAQQSDPAPEPEARAAYAGAVFAAESVLTGYTRLAPEERIAARSVTRAEWAGLALSGWRWLLEHLAQRLATGFGAASGDPADAMEALMKQVAPLMLGVQTGTLLGHLSLEVHGRYDLPVPFDDVAEVFFVDRNITAMADDYGFERDAFRRWLALRDAARHVVLGAGPWVARYHRSLLIELVDSIEIDMGGVQRRIEELQSGGMEALQEGIGVDAFMPIVPTERHRKASEKLAAFFATFDGYATHATNQVAASLGADDPRIAEAIARHEASPSEGKALIRSMLGIEVDRSLAAAGTTFAAAIAKLRGVPALNLLWAAPDYLPSVAEIRDPFMWIERVLDEQ